MHIFNDARLHLSSNNKNNKEALLTLPTSQDLFSFFAHMEVSKRGTAALRRMQIGCSMQEMTLPGASPSSLATTPLTSKCFQSTE